MTDIQNYESLSDHARWNVLAMVSNLYYNAEMTQSQIAKRLCTSRSTVSRLLKEARELGVVEITIREPWRRDSEREKALKEQFGLKHVRVVISRENDDAENKRAMLAEVAAFFLDSIIQQNMVVGISWGTTLYSIVKYMAANNCKNLPLTVVPIMGAANINSPERDAMDLAKQLAAAYGGKYQYIYAPLFVKTREIRESYEQDDSVRIALNMARHADIMLSSVGSIRNKSWSNVLSPHTLDMLESRGVVGHVGGHFYDIHGRELQSSIRERMIGVSLEDFRRCRYSICAALGESKGEAALGALRAGIFRTLITDDACADKILQCAKESRTEQASDSSSLT